MKSQMCGDVIALVMMTQQTICFCYKELMKLLHNFMESLILAQDERWRRA